MYYAKHNLTDVDGNMIASGTKGVKPESLGEKSVIERYLNLGAIVKGGGESEAEDSVIVTGEVDDKQQAKAEKKAVK